MLRLELLPAGCGDCLWLEYGQPGKTRIMIVDGGVAETAPRLSARIKRAMQERGAADLHVELLVITHIDKDHIDGVLGLLEGHDPRITFGDVWFNGDQQLSNLLGPQEGDRLSKLLAKRGFAWNRAFGGSPIEVPAELTRPLLQSVLQDDLRLTILGPTSKRLERLSAVWQRVIGEFDATLAASTDREDLLGRRDAWPPVYDESESIDRSPANGSSIVLLVEYESSGQEHALLLTGDAFPQDIQRAIVRLQRQRERDNDPLWLDAFKLSHHGSAYNVSQELLGRLDCSRYLVSTDGSGHAHPDHQAMLRVIQFGGCRPRLMFNYDVPTTRDWRDRKKDVLKHFPNYETEYPDDPEAGLALDWE